MSAPNPDTSAEERERLLPCPFCGGVASVDIRKPNPPQSNDGWSRVSCKGASWAGNETCAIGPSTDFFRDDQSTVSEAIDAWNRRAPALSDEQCQSSMWRCVKPDGHEGFHVYEQTPKEEERS